MRMHRWHVCTCVTFSGISAHPYLERTHCETLATSGSWSEPILEFRCKMIICNPTSGEGDSSPSSYIISSCKIYAFCNKEIKQYVEQTEGKNTLHTHKQLVLILIELIEHKHNYAPGILCLVTLYHIWCYTLATDQHRLSHAKSHRLHTFHFTTLVVIKAILMNQSTNKQLVSLCSQSFYEDHHTLIDPHVYTCDARR